jgi:hypothetical protein
MHCALIIAHGIVEHRIRCERFLKILSAGKPILPPTGSIARNRIALAETWRSTSLLQDLTYSIEGPNFVMVSTIEPRKITGCR